jgi:DnaJ family protein C protein 7
VSSEAIKLYSKAISLEPNIGSYFGNRAAAWLRVGATDECIADCRRCLELAPDHTKSHLRLCKVSLAQS